MLTCSLPAFESNRTVHGARINNLAEIAAYCEEHGMMFPIVVALRAEESAVIPTKHHDRAYLSPWARYGAVEQRRLSLTQRAVCFSFSILSCCELMVSVCLET